MRQGFNSNRSSFSNERNSDRAGRGSNFRPRGRGPFRGHQPYRPPTQGQIDNLMQLAQESVTAETGFSKLPMESLLLGALKSETFENPTPIQSEAIPLGLLGRDILGCAQTGTGKTLAFVIPLLNQLLQKPDSKALILAPTRELALQIEEVIKPLSKKINLGLPVILIGGVSYHNQFRSLDEPHRIIVATPGRLIDHLGQQTVNLSAVQSLVLDEADRMLDVGFKPQLLEILQYLPKERQTMMFTATLSAGVKSLSVKYLVNPAHLKVGETDRAHENITQKVIQLETSKKNEAVLELLKENTGTALIFVKTQIKTERVAKALEDFGVVTAPIHGGLNQGQRKRALEAFRSEQVRVLVATDVAARGLDIDHVALVINYDLPQVLEDYVHRIGRTGRAGRTGIAVSLVSGEDRGLWRLIERKYISKDNQPNTRGPREFSEGRRERSGGSDFRRDRRPDRQEFRQDRGGYKPRGERAEFGGGGERTEYRSERPAFRRDRSESQSETPTQPRREYTPRPKPAGDFAEKKSFARREDSPAPRREKTYSPSHSTRGEASHSTRGEASHAPRREKPAREEYRAKPKSEGFFSKRKTDDEGGSWGAKKSSFKKKTTSTGPFKGKSPRKTFRKSED